MPRPVLRLHNHKRRILGLQPSTEISLYPGMICSFRYKKDNVQDPHPLVLVIWNDYQGYKIHGVNLNYLTDLQVRKIFSELQDKGSATAEDDLPIAVEDQEESSYDDELPNRNLLKKEFTRLKLPTYKESQDGKKISKSVAQTQMKMLYEGVIKKYVERLYVYRSYSYEYIMNTRVVTYDIEGMLK